jgi:hypothetical protein
MNNPGGRKAARSLAAAAFVVSIAGIATPAFAAPPGGPTTTHCRVRVEHAVLAPESTIVRSAHGAVNPGLVLPAGNGEMRVELANGGRVALHADYLICRRDGGTVPAHGGANIADVEGTAQMFDGGKPVDVRFQVHVEDRGAGRETEDYFALRLSDVDNNELLFDANFLVSGDIKLVPSGMPIRLP